MKNMISQELLEKYQQLSAQEKKYKAQRETLRDQIVEMLNNGASVEVGSLDAELQTYSQKTLSKAKVVAAIGQEQYEWLRADIAPTIKTNLRVQSKSHSHPHKAVKGKDTWLEVSYEDWP